MVKREVGKIATFCSFALFQRNADFNLCLIQATISEAKSMKGTPYWMAPEVIRQTGHNWYELLSVSP
jgi:serine/threonine protein kinase